MSRSYLPTSKTNSCPICGDVSGKCRSKTNNRKEFFLCMNFSDAKFKEVSNGFKCIAESNPSKSYSCATFVLDDSAEWSQEKRAQWEAEKHRKQEEKAREDEERKRNSLSVCERHKWYLKLLNYLTLNEADLADLKRRGFSDDEIRLSGFKSIEKYQKLPEKFPSKLPGISDNGTFLINRNAGYLCPIRNFKGQITAFQVRARSVDDGNRYQWLSSKQAVLHLQNGELPLAIFAPEKPEGIALVEGTGAKPFLTSQHLNLLVIGAAGGQFLSSPEIFKEYLYEASKRLETEEIIIYPDAGDINNNSVMNRWHQVIKFLEDLGYLPKIAWWNQATKEHNDIDELDTFDLINYLTPDNFFKIAERAQKEAKAKEIIEAEKAKKAKEDELYTELTSITEKPWKVVNQKEIDLQSFGLKDGAIYIIISAKGTGKTKGVKPILDSYKAGYAWFSRIALGKEECHKLDITWKDDITTFTPKKLGTTSDSAYKYDPKILSKNRSFLLIDECDQVFDHNFGDTCNKDGKRPMILATLEAHLEATLYGGGIGIFMSADISQKEIDYIKELTPVGYPVRVILNEYQPPKCPLYFDESDKPDGMIEKLLAYLEADIPCFAIDDIKNGVRGCKSIAEYIRNVHPEWADKIVEINSDTSGDAFVSEYLKLINKASLETLLIICSPSVVSGISIENGRFNYGVFGFFNGVLTINNALQALSRVRGAEEVNVWAAETGLVYASNRATDPKEINEYYQRNYEQNSKHLLNFGVHYSPIKSEWSSPHWKLKCKNDAYRNLCMNDLRERLRTKLEEEGYQLTPVSDQGSDMVTFGLKDAWGKIELADAEAVANASILGDKELNMLQNSPTALKPEQKRDVEKTLMLKFFGKELIEATKFTHKETGKELTGYAAIYLKNERGDYLRKLQNFYFFTQQINEAIHSDLSREHSQEKHGFGRFPGDIRWRTRAAKCREFLGLKDFLNPELWTEPKDYQELFGKAREMAPAIKDCLGVNVEKVPQPSQVFRALLEQLGLDLISERVEGAVDASGKRKFWRRRKITEESWQFCQMYVNHRLSQKQQSEQSKPVESGQIVAIAPPPNLYRNQFLEGGCDQEKASDGTSFNAAVDGQITLITPPPNLYRSDFLRGGCDQEKASSEMPKTLTQQTIDRKARLRAATEYVKSEIRDAIEWGSVLNGQIVKKDLETYLSQFGDDASKVSRKAIEELGDEWQRFNQLIWRDRAS